MNGEKAMSDCGTLIKEALEQGFSFACELNVGTLEFMPEVRAMCAADRCQSYGRSWNCPPGCGTVEEAAQRASAFKQGILVQTIGQLEDDFDWEGIEAAHQTHRVNFEAFTAKLRGRFSDLMPMGVGACSICEECTYPDAPCRYPERAVPPMEAYGLFVSKVCTLSGAKYNNGPQTITFTSCYLF